MKRYFNVVTIIGIIMWFIVAGIILFFLLTEPKEAGNYIIYLIPPVVTMFIGIELIGKGKDE
ncbi:MAG: hypothetical protein J1E41_01590 [Ruminococcus sp.]|nr:hypothetical protein [Ruminococcus sp.]